MATMQALCLRSTEPKDVAVLEVEKPEAGPDQVLLKVQKVGICGSDRSASLGKKNFDWVERPRILGHEFSATIEDVGSRVSGWKAGDRVVPIAVKGCLEPTCPPCSSGNTQLCRKRQFMGLSREGAMAEYVAIEHGRLIRLHDGLTYLQGSIVEPLSVASRCVIKHSRIGPSDRVVISGPGIIGLLCGLMAKAAGAEVTLTGIPADTEVRLKTAEDLGFSTIVVTEENPLSEQLGNPDDDSTRADVYIEASGAPSALATAGECLKWGGTLSIIATYAAPITWNATYNVRAEQRITTTMASARDDFEAAMRHLADGLIPIEKIAQEFTLANAVGAFEASWDCTTPKAIIDCS